MPAYVPINSHQNLIRFRSPDKSAGRKIRDNRNYDSERGLSAPAEISKKRMRRTGRTLSEPAGIIADFRPLVPNLFNARTDARYRITKIDVGRLVEIRVSGADLFPAFLSLSLGHRENTGERREGERAKTRLGERQGERERRGRWTNYLPSSFPFPDDALPSPLPAAESLRGKPPAP